MRHKIILVLVSVFLFFAILGVSLSVSKVTVTGKAAAWVMSDVGEES